MKLFLRMIDKVAKGLIIINKFRQRSFEKVAKVLISVRKGWFQWYMKGPQKFRTQFKKGCLKISYEKAAEGLRRVKERAVSNVLRKAYARATWTAGCTDKNKTTNTAKNSHTSRQWPNNGVGLHVKQTGYATLIWLHHLHVKKLYQSNFVGGLPRPHCPTHYFHQLIKISE